MGTDLMYLDISFLSTLYAPWLDSSHFRRLLNGFHISHNMKFFGKKKYRDYDFNPDEIFMDTINVSGLDQQQFEGVIEQRIPKKTLFFFISVIIVIAAIFSVQLFRLQIVKGETFARQAESNRLNTTPLFAERGIIYDRNNVELSWNTSREDQEYLSRSYISNDGYGHLLGYVNYPQKDDNGNFWRQYVVGQDGLEKKYDELLQGTNGARLYEVNARGEVLSQQHLRPSYSGDNLITTIDARLQSPLYAAIEKQSQEALFQAGAAAVMNIHTGELLTLTSYPEYDPYTLAEGDDAEAISGFFNDPSKPFLNRAISGLYSPGSTVKPFLALAALNENLITDTTTILSTGRIEVPNRFNPGNGSIFRDWRPEGHGITDVYHAIADSVNTFFYAIGGGYRDQEGLGISGIDEYMQLFKVTEKTGIDFGSEVTGVIPTPEWKERIFADGAWRLGDTYNTSIGQFGFQVGVLQMTRAMSALANGGTLYTPQLIADAKPESERVARDIPDEHYEVIRVALRQTVTEGTARLLNVKEVAMAAKTGTAQVGVNNEYKNSWALGFFPYENPQYAFAVVMEKAPNTESNQGSAARVMRDFIVSVTENNPEFWEELK